MKVPLVPYGRYAGMERSVQTSMPTVKEESVYADLSIMKKLEYAVSSTALMYIILHMLHVKCKTINAKES